MPEDVPAIASLFTKAFKKSVMHACGKLPHTLAMEDVFTLVYRAEPKAAFVARDDSGCVVGYVFAPTKVKRLWQQAVFGGYLLKWFWRWAIGRYGIGLYPVKIIMADKWSFVLSALKKQVEADARILSIAVEETARAKGVGKGLMERAMAYFEEQKVKRIRLEVRPSNTPAKKIYEQLGFVSYGFTHDSQGPWLIMFKEMEQR